MHRARLRPGGQEACRGCPWPWPWPSPFSWGRQDGAKRECARVNWQTGCPVQPERQIHSQEWLRVGVSQGHRLSPSQNTARRTSRPPGPAASGEAPSMATGTQCASWRPGELLRAAGDWPRTPLSSPGPSTRPSARWGIPLSGDIVSSGQRPDPLTRDSHGSSSGPGGPLCTCVSV